MKKNILSYYFLILFLIVSLFACERRPETAEFDNTESQPITNEKEKVKDDTYLLLEKIKVFKYKIENSRDPFIPLNIPPKKIDTAENNANVSEQKKDTTKIIDSAVNKKSPEVKVEAPQSVPPKPDSIKTDANESIKKEKTDNQQAENKFPDITISGILFNQKDPMVMIKDDDRIFKEGMAVDADGKVIIRKIEEDKIVLEMDEAGIKKTKIVNFVK